MQQPPNTIIPHHQNKNDHVLGRSKQRDDSSSSSSSSSTNPSSSKGVNSSNSPPNSGTNGNNPTAQEKLYRPMLLRFRCIGALSLTPPSSSVDNDTNDTNDNSSNSTNNSNALQHTCQGIRSRLLPLGEYPTMTAHDALQNFAHAAAHNRSDVAASSTAAGFGGGGGGGGANTNKKKKKNTNNDKDTTNNNGFEKGLPHIIDPKWIELQAHLNEEEEGGGGRSTSSSSSAVQTILPPRSRMDFYGSTEVGVLLLRPYQQIHHHPRSGIYPTSPSPHQQQQSKSPSQPPPSSSSSQPPKIRVSSEQYSDTELDETTLSESIVYAISPENTFGLSMREMNEDNEEYGTTTGGTWSTVKVGMVEVSLASRHEGVFVDEDEEEDKQQQGGGRRTIDGKSSAPSSSPMTEEQAVVPTSLTEKAEGYYDKVTIMGGKLGKSMSLNVEFIKNELQDDFLARSVVGGEKVVQSFGKHLGRMEKLAGDVYDFLKDSSGDGSGGGARR